MNDLSSTAGADVNNQMILPPLITSLFTAECAPVTQTALPAGTQTFPSFSYSSTALRTAWDIAAEQNSCAA